MEWVSVALDELGKQPVCGYAAAQRPASEPTAIATLALAGHGRAEAALQGARWLARQQAADGAVGIREGDSEPGWPTSLALLAWRRCQSARDDRSSDEFAQPIQRGVRWLMGLRGKTSQRSDDVGHDTMLTAWPWVDGTHSWVEPTSMAVLALRAVGESEHSRTREAFRLLEDRLLPDGGCNYGNTTVLGQLARPHLLPTGLALAALAGQDDSSGRIGKSIRYLQNKLTATTATLSLAWGVVGLAAQRAPVGDEAQWLAAAAARARRVAVDRWRLALVCFAALGELALRESLADEAKRTGGDR